MTIDASDLRDADASSSDSQMQKEDHVFPHHVRERERDCRSDFLSVITLQLAGPGSWSGSFTFTLIQIHPELHCAISAISAAFARCHGARWSASASSRRPRRGQGQRWRGWEDAKQWPELFVFKQFLGRFGLEFHGIDGRGNRWNQDGMEVVGFGVFGHRSSQPASSRGPNCPAILTALTAPGNAEERRSAMC